MCVSGVMNSNGAGRRGVIVCALVVLAAAAGCAPGRTASVNRSFPSLVLPSRAPVAVARAKPAKVPITGCPKIFSRLDWNAAAPDIHHINSMGKITRITIHHAGMGIEEKTSLDAVKAELRSIQRSHKNFRHWADIGYHYIIDGNGRVWEGRPIKYQGAHAGNKAANKGNIGIVVMGNFNLQRPSPAQMASLQTLVEYLMRKYAIPVSQVYTHREISARYGLHATECPGKYLQEKVNAMRRRLADAGKPGK